MGRSAWPINNRHNYGGYPITMLCGFKKICLKNIRKIMHCRNYVLIAFLPRGIAGPFFFKLKH